MVDPSCVAYRDYVREAEFETFTAERWPAVMEIDLTMLTAGIPEPLRPAQAKKIIFGRLFRR
jgi:hypothetical protein